MGTRQPPRSFDSQSMIFDILFVVFPVFPSCWRRKLCRLWVGDVSIEASEQDLIDLFEPCGEVEMICLQA
jgi:hypothetical protein